MVSSPLKTSFNQNTSLAAPGVFTHRLQCHTTCKIQIGCQGALKLPMVSGKVSTPKLLVLPVPLNKLFDLSTPFMRKVNDGGNRKKIMIEIVAMNVVAN